MIPTILADFTHIDSGTVRGLQEDASRLLRVGDEVLVIEDGNPQRTAKGTVVDVWRRELVYIKVDGRGV